MNNKQEKTFKLIFENPVRSDIAWADIEKLLEALGAQISEGNGSRVRVALNERAAVFHRPHPERITNQSTVRSVRKFLINAGVEYKEGQNEI